MTASSSEGTPSAPRHRHYTAAEWARTLVISAGVGVGITLVIGLASPQHSRWVDFLGGALIGACIGFGAAGLDYWVVRPLERFARVPVRAIRVIAFFAGGVAGWLAGSYAAEALLGFQPWPSVGYSPMWVFGGVSVVVGLLFEAYGRLRNRLEQSVAELKEREFAEKELATARTIQRRLLPPETARGDGYRLAAVNLPARVVAGDFYDYFRLPDGALGVAVADVSGKGMGASLIMASTKAMLQLVAAERSAAQALDELNRKLHGDLARREFVALLLVRFDPESGEIELANAGLPDPYLLAAGRPPTPLEAPGPRLPLGLRPEVGYQSLRLALRPGERLLLFTDGLAEARDERGEPFGYERLTASLATPALAAEAAEGDGLRRWLDTVVGAVASEGQPLDDDCTAVVLERLRPAGSSLQPRALGAR
jgi:serine phosphatase RsbU (regulator of sigma subunit)